MKRSYFAKSKISSEINEDAKEVAFLSNDLSLEISGNSEKAVNAIDKLINKLTEYQNKLVSVVPKMNQFNNILKNIPSGSGNRYKELANGINAVANALKKFDNKTSLSSLKSELEMIKRSSVGLDITAKKLNDVANAMNTTGSASKLSVQLAKYQSEIDIANAKAQSANAKASYDIENYAVKTQKLAAAKEKLAEAQRKVAEDAQWEQNAQKSLQEATSRLSQEYENELKNRNIDTPSESKTYTPKIPRQPVRWTKEQLQNQAEVDALYRTSYPEFDNSKINETIRETQEFINSLMPAMENMSATAQNRFDLMAEKLKDVNVEIEKQKQLYKNLTEDYATLSKRFSPDILANDGFEEKIEAAKQKIETFTAQSDRLKRSMERLANPTNQASNAIKKAGNESHKASKMFSTFDRVLRNIKTYFLVGAVNKLSESFANALQSAMNFTENMNLFNISLGKNVGSAGEFVDKMSAIFGMDLSNLLNTMGNFYQISHSIGMTSKNAYVLSENFTKLANDLSSFYNISVNDAAVKLQAGLVGETEPLRRLGIIITENALKQTAYNLGIEKSVRDMSETEKMHLRYITVMQQTANIQGDFARTISEPAQMFRILQEQMSQFARAIGSVFMPILGAVLPYIIAFARALTTVIGVFARFLGYKIPEYKNFSIADAGAGDLGKAVENANTGTGKLGKSLGKAAKQAKEFKKQVMSFDELNILNKPTETPESGGGTGSGRGAGGGIGDFAVPDLTGYDNLMDGVNNKIDEIYSNIMNTFQKIGEALEPTMQAFERLGVELDRLGKFACEGLLDFYNSFLVPVGSWVLGEGLPRFIDAITNGLAKVDFGNINSSLHTLWTVLTPFAIAIGEGLLWFWEKVLVPLGSWTLNSAVSTFLNFLAGAISILTPIINGCVAGFDWLWTIYLEPLASWTGGIICDVLNELAGILGTIGDWMSNNQDVISNTITLLVAFFALWKVAELLSFIETSGGVIAALSAIGKAIAGVTIQKIADKFETIALTSLYAKDFVVSLAKGTLELGKQVLQWGILAVKTAAQATLTGAATAAQWLLNAAMNANPIGILIVTIGALIAAFVLLWNNCEGFRNFWMAAWETIVFACETAGNFINDFFTKQIPEIINMALNWIKENWQGLLLLLINPFLGAFKLIYGNSEEFRNFIDTLVQNIGQFFFNLWTNISSCGQVCWENILRTWSVVSDWFNSNIIRPVSNFFMNLWNNIKNWALNCWNGVFSIWNVVSGWFDSNIISPLKNLFSSLWSKIQSIFSSTSSWFGNIFTNAYNAVKSAFSGVTNFFSGIWQNIKSTFTNIGSTIGNAIGGAFRNVVNSIINFAENSINGFIRAINSAISVINLIPGVNISTIRELRIPRLAKGGLVTESMLVNIGEGADAEAILPLNDKVFSKLAEGINKNNADNPEIISEESLYKAFVRALQDAPEKTATFALSLNNKIIAREVLKEQQTQNRRFSPVSL